MLPRNVGVPRMDSQHPMGGCGGFREMPTQLWKTTAGRPEGAAIEMEIRPQP